MASPRRLLDLSVFLLWTQLQHTSLAKCTTAMEAWSCESHYVSLCRQLLAMPACS